jgi:Transposase IS116/IS110/IS902 family
MGPSPQGTHHTSLLGGRAREFPWHQFAIAAQWVFIPHELGMTAPTPRPRASHRRGPPAQRAAGYPGSGSLFAASTLVPFPPKSAAAQVIIAEIGVDMGRFPTPGHLISWARFAPGVMESAGKRKGKATTGHGNPYLARVLGEAAAAAGKTDAFLGERYRRIARRRGTKRGHGRGRPLHPDHRLAPAGRPRRSLPRPGPGFYHTRIDAERRKRNHVRQLEVLGYKVTLLPAA